jgi:hypothetical protein
MDPEREAYLINQERQRIWDAISAHWKGDMGPAFRAAGGNWKTWVLIDLALMWWFARTSNQ